MTLDAGVGVIESVVLFMNVQRNHVSRSTTKQVKPSLTVAIDTVQTGLSSSTAQCVFNVVGSGLGAYFLDGNVFLKTLFFHNKSLLSLLQQSSSSVPASLPPGSDPLMEVLARRAGEPDNVSRNLVVKLDNSLDVEVVGPVVREMIAQRPAGLHPAALLVKFKLCVLRETIQSQVIDFTKQLGLLHLINPQITVSVCVKDSVSPLLQVVFDSEIYKTLPKSPFKLVTAAHRYMYLSSSAPSRLRLFKGDTQIISDCLSLNDGKCESLKLYSMVAVLPNVRLVKGQKIPANRLCGRLNIFVYCLHSLPLIRAGSHPGFPLSALADWDSYGLTVNCLHASNILPRGNHTVTAPCYTCELGNTRLEQTSRASSMVANKHTLYLFIFFEGLGVGERHKVTDNIQMRHCMDFLHTLRREFDGLVVSQSKKFHSVIHSALNKVVCNYGSHAKTKSVMRTALPLLADAMASIVKNSPNKHFQRTALHIMKADSLDSICEKVEEKLWKIAEDKVKVSHPTDVISKNHDEPTTPELSVATSTTDPKDSTSSKSEIIICSDSTRENSSSGLKVAQDPMQRELRNYTSSQEVICPHTDTDLHNTGSRSSFSARIMSKTRNHKDDKYVQKEMEDLSGDEDCFESLSDFSEGCVYHQETPEDQMESLSQDSLQVSQLLIGSTFDSWVHTQDFCTSDDFSASDSFSVDEASIINEVEDCSLEAMDCDLSTRNHPITGVPLGNCVRSCDGDNLATKVHMLQVPNDTYTHSQAPSEGPLSIEDVSICLEEKSEQMVTVARGSSVSQQHSPTRDEQAKECVEHTATSQSLSHTTEFEATSTLNAKGVLIYEEIVPQTSANADECISDDEWNGIVSCSTFFCPSDERKITSGQKQMEPFVSCGNFHLANSEVGHLSSHGDDAEGDFDLLARHELEIRDMETDSRNSVPCAMTVYDMSSAHMESSVPVSDVNDDDFEWD